MIILMILILILININDNNDIINIIINDNVMCYIEN